MDRYLKRWVEGIEGAIPPLGHHCAECSNQYFATAVLKYFLIGCPQMSLLVKMGYHARWWGKSFYGLCSQTWTTANSVEACYEEYPSAALYDSHATITI